MPASRRRGRRKGVDLREGSVAQARKEAGLTLAEVAGAKLSRTAIHLVEKGLVRPSMQTLRLIARRTGKPLAFFLQDHISAGRGGSKELQEATTNLAAALSVWEAKKEVQVQAKVCMVMGQLEEWCGNSANADQQFEKAIGIVEHAGTLEQLRDAHMVYAEVLDGRQDTKKSAHQWKLAAEIGKLAAIQIDRSPSAGETGRSVGTRSTKTA